MICSGCGKDIPFSGTVCPYCQRDKSGDQATQLLAFVFGAAGATIGYLVDGFGYSMAGLFIGVVVGAGIGVVKNAGKAQPPEVRIDAPAGSPPSVGADRLDTAERLRRLDELKSLGLVSELEYTERRGKILDTL